MCPWKTSMNSNVDRTYNVKVTETPTEKSVARKPKKQRERFLFLVGASPFISLAFFGNSDAVLQNTSGPSSCG
jgi:hypothetical protein